MSLRALPNDPNVFWQRPQNNVSISSLDCHASFFNYVVFTFLSPVLLISRFLISQIFNYFPSLHLTCIVSTPITVGCIPPDLLSLKI